MKMIMLRKIKIGWKIWCHRDLLLIILLLCHITAKIMIMTGTMYLQQASRVARLIIVCQHINHNQHQIWTIFHLVPTEQELTAEGDNLDNNQIKIYTLMKMKSYIANSKIWGWICKSTKKICSTPLKNNSLDAQGAKPEKNCTFKTKISYPWKQVFLI